MLFVIGILTVNDLAARDFKITISGKVGPFQRGVLVALAALFFAASVVGFYWLANKPSGSDKTPPPPDQTVPARQMTLKLLTRLPDDEEVVQQTDVITIGGVQVTLTVNSDSPTTSDVVHFEGSDPGDVDYSVKVTLVYKDGSTGSAEGSGTVFVDNGLAYEVTLRGDPPQPALEKSA
ncbi:hypothetical protein [Streptomyces albireticuli]|uniref:hypothetical protein n=1 Tax=Streptomyces albireticuli TaxID=1940 RepID=UPI0036A7253C